MRFIQKGLLLSLLLCFCGLKAESSNTQKHFVLDNPHHLLIPKSVDFVNTLSNELFAKTGYGLYVALVDTTPDVNTLDSTPTIESNAQDFSHQKRQAYSTYLQSSLPRPYTLIIFMLADKKISILSSSPNTYLDEDKVFFEYMIPLLPKQNEPIDAKLASAIVLNGYAMAADMIAEHFGVFLEHNMPIDESGGKSFVRFSMYAMLLIMFGIIGVIYLTRKRA